MILRKSNSIATVTIVAAVEVLVMTWASNNHAGIVNVSDPSSIEVLSPPPTNVEPNVFESDNKVFAFQEQRNLLLDDDLRIDTTVGDSIVRASVIPQGTRVDSYLFHGDPENNRRRNILIGPVEVTFSSSILGFYFTTEGLVATDEILGHSDTTYETEIFNRGAIDYPLRANSPRDLVSIVDDKSISIRFAVKGPGAIDEIRVLTEGTVKDFLLPGDADQDLDFDQLDLVGVQFAGKYLTGQPATWGEGDWDGAPGGAVGSPPNGNGFFDQLDVIAALGSGIYLTGPYAAVQPNGQSGDGQTSIVYNAGTGEVAIDAPAGVELTSINIDSASGIFTGEAVQSLGGSFDNDSDINIFKATFGGTFGSISFGNVAQAGLTEESLLGDLSVVGSLAGGGDLGSVDLVYVPEPASVLLLSVGLAIGLVHFKRVNR